MTTMASTTIRMAWALAALCAALAFVGAQAAECPPPGFDSAKDFNISAWVDHPWYIQRMMPVFYLPEDRFYCVRASYEQVSDDTVEVSNVAREGSVDGKESGGDMTLNANIPDLDDPSKLRVGPAFLPPSLYGQYWVVFAGGENAPEEYDYGIVSGGPPTLQSGDACIAGTPADVVS